MTTSSGREEVKRVMISSTTIDLPDHRERVKQACLLRGMLPKMMEHLPANDDDAIKASLRLVDEADLYLGIFAYRYGHIPQGHKISITEMEYNRADDRKIPCKIFIMHDDHPIKAADIEKGVGAIKIEALKERLRKSRVVNVFRSPEELATLVINSLVEYEQSTLTASRESSEIPQPAIVPPTPRDDLSKPAKPPQRWNRKNVLIALLIIPIVFATLLGGVAAIILHQSPPIVLPDTGIGIMQPANGQDMGLGICDGSCVFDVNRLDGNLKNEAAANFTTHPDLAAQYWDMAHQDDMTDAETSIYSENQNVLASHKPYKIFIVAAPFPMSQDEATALSKHDASALAKALTTLPSPDDMNSIYIGRDILQGVYVQQKEYNDSHSNMQVYLLIANIGSPSSQHTTSNQQTVATQIKQAMHNDSRIIGVVGLPFGSTDLISALNQANIPMVSIAPAEYESSNQYLLSVAPSINDEANAAVSYLNQKRHFQHIFVAYASDEYSSKLANAFINTFATIAPLSATQSYPTGSISDIKRIAQEAVNDQVDAIYFVGPYTDTTALLVELHSMHSQIVVMGGNNTYQSIHAPASLGASLTGMFFTAFAFPDEWRGHRLPGPPFIQDYETDYNPDKTHTGNPYTYSRAGSDTILSYDAMSLLTNASDIALQKGLTLTSKNLLTALRQFTPGHKFQSISGQISFAENNSVPYKKAVLILSIQPTQLVSIQGGSYL